ncbi:MAG: AraC family transcriptional regulator [Fuerstiella sp.]
MRTVEENYFRYIPVRKSDLDWGLHVTGAGSTSVPSGYDAYPLTPHPSTYDFTWDRGRKLPEYTAVYLSSGCGDFESTPTGGMQISEGTLLLLFPGVWHRYRPCVEKGWHEHWVSFSGEWMDRLVERDVFSPQRPVLNLENSSTVLSAFEMLLTRLKQEVPGFPQLMSANTAEILAAALAEHPSESIDPLSGNDQQLVSVDDRLVADALRLIWDQSKGDLTVTDLEQQLPVTRRHLERRFRGALGHTIHDEILRCRMERARRLLSNTDMLMKEVAVAAGFPNADNMGRTFRRLEGRSPKEFRQQAEANRAKKKKKSPPVDTDYEACYMI